MPAPTYIEHLMGWIQSNIDNEAVFPSRIGMLAHPSITPNSNPCRRSIPKVFPEHDQTSIQENVPSLRPYLLPPLPCHP